MEQSGFKEILSALELHSGHINAKMDQMKEQLEKRIDDTTEALEKRIDDTTEALEKRMDERFDQVEKRFDNLESKFDGMRIELTETQETVDFLSSKNVQHEKKLRKIYTKHS